MNFRKVKLYSLILIIIIDFVLSSCDLSSVLVENKKHQSSNQATIDPITTTQKIDRPTNKTEMIDQSLIILTPTGHDKENDRLSLEITDSITFIDVVSPTGIGKAKITTSTGHWPQRLIFRFHLQALEGFQVSADNHHFSYSLEPEENTSRYNRAQAGQKLEPIEVELPSAWLKEAPNGFNIQWVDWYR
jgi:hypothetical protein